MQAWSQCKHVFLFWSNKLLLSSLLLFGLTALQIGPRNPWWDKRDRRTHVHHTHACFRALAFSSVRTCASLFAFVSAPACRCVRAAGLQRMNQQVLTHVSESGLPAGLPARRRGECKGGGGGGNKPQKTPSMIKCPWPCFRGRPQQQTRNWRQRWKGKEGEGMEIRGG